MFISVGNALSSISLQRRDQRSITRDGFSLKRECSELLGAISDSSNFYQTGTASWLSQLTPSSVLEHTVSGILP